MKAKKSILFAIFLIGFTAISAQIVLLRQMLVIFYGNELSLGLMLGAWLFWGALGSWLLGRYADNIRQHKAFFSILQIILALILPGIIFVVRSARAILGIAPGEIIGFLPMALFSFLIFSLICIILGFLFVLACRIYPRQISGAGQIGRVYILEALGAVCGGLLTSFCLIPYFDAFYIMLGLAFLNLCSSFFLQHNLKELKIAQITKYITLGLILCLLALVFTQQAKQIKQTQLAQQWRGFELLTAEDSVYSNLVVTKRAEQYSFFSNGLSIFTVPDEQSCEEAVHFALLETLNPQNVLLIGGGIAGLAQEILKYPIHNLDYLELDPKIIALGRQFLPSERLSFLADRRLRVFHQDGRQFIKQISDIRKLSDVKIMAYDSIIVYVGDPYTAQLNRFYTNEFFQEIKSWLIPGGVFSFSLSSAENFLNPEQQQFLSSIYKTLTSVFAEVKVIPGDTAYFLAAGKAGILTYDYQELMRRLKKRAVQTKYVREYYLQSKLSQDRIEYLAAKIESAQEQAKLNRDFRPISYYYDMLLFSTYFTSGWRKIIAVLNEKIIWAFFCFAYLVILASAFLRRKKKNAASGAVLLAVSTTGLTELTFQVVILLAFQVIYGYLYYKLGIMLSSFMVGLVLGSWLITKRLSLIKDDYGLFIKTQIAIVIYPIILPLVFFALNSARMNSWQGWAGANIIFPL
ncbi:MAG: fused MFS/spermidine synthase, partial [Candidatus Omnitrophica bacterium]|nr:fused MFS/spermidine synthase [Candidatus Omnitrophota bacterium]